MSKESMIKDIMTALECTNPLMSNGERYSIRRRLQSMNENLVRREWREKIPEEMRNLYIKSY